MLTNAKWVRMEITRKSEMYLPNGLVWKIHFAMYRKRSRATTGSVTARRALARLGLPHTQATVAGSPRLGKRLIVSRSNPLQSVISLEESPLLRTRTLEIFLPQAVQHQLLPRVSPWGRGAQSAAHCTIFGTPHEPVLLLRYSHQVGSWSTRNTINASAVYR